MIGWIICRVLEFQGIYVKLGLNLISKVEIFAQSAPLQMIKCKSKSDRLGLFYDSDDCTVFTNSAIKLEFDLSNV